MSLPEGSICAISANTFTIVKKIGVAVREESGSITISANNFSDSWIGRDPDGQPIHKRDSEPSRTEQNPNEATGILLENCEALVISANLFSGLVGQPIRQVGDCRKVLIDGNGLQELKSE